MQHKWKRRGMHIGYWWKSQKERDGMDWIDLAQDRDQWRALVNMVMNLCIP
jgi:hypothetical protein